MTLVVGALPPMVLGQRVTVSVTIGGASPVHAVRLDLLQDGQPAWYFTMFDARGVIDYNIGPFKRRGRTEFTAYAVDEMGCEVNNGVRLFVTVQ